MSATSSSLATKLEEIILAMKGTPNPGAGLWGVFARATQETANALGEKSALIALGEGENRGRSDYESTLDERECHDRLQRFHSR